MEIWPAIDLRGGKCVRLQQGDYGRETIFGDDPTEPAKKWVAAGAKRLHLVDLDGARDGLLVNRDAVARIVKASGVPCQLGGGVRDEATIRQLFDLGLARLVVGTKALREPEWFAAMTKLFPGKLALGIDARDGRVATDGWLTTSDVSAAKLAQELSSLPIAAIIYTDIARDGMLAGPNVPAMKQMREGVSIPVIASGGVTTLDDVRDLAAAEMHGCIIGRAIYEGRFELADAIKLAGD